MGRHCLCNALMANIGHAQVRAEGRVEPPLLTSGDDLASIGGFLRGRTSYTAAQVLDYLLDGETQQVGTIAGAEAQQPGP